MLEEWNWTVGEVVAPFGIAGEVKVRIESDFPDRFERLKEVCLRPRIGEPKLFAVERSRLHKRHALLKLRGIATIAEADLWRGAWVQVRRADAVPLPSDSFYVSDLVGMEVVTAKGRALGRVDAVLNYPAQDLLQIGDVLIPMVREFIREVDTARHTIVVSPPDGLLPDEEAEIVAE
jgi:16S rRNA processing protein RimM